jgi:hypothetical protein
VSPRVAHVPDPPCPNEAEHTPCPVGYLAWHAWASHMSRTHGQRKCPDCGRWAIWYERSAGRRRSEAT